MIILADMGHLFWTHYYATRSDIDAYTLTVDKLREYHDECERLAVCCDCPPLLRTKAYPEYKANREEKPKEALDSLRSVEQQVESWGVPVVRVEGYEADDVIAALALQAGTEDVRIVSNDKDLYQLISDNVLMVKRDGRIVDADECRKKFGVSPAQMLDYLTLVGDTSDNVPGCPSVGPGRARDLLVRFGSIDAMLAKTDEEIRTVRGVGEKTMTALRAWDPEPARKLIALAWDAPIKIEKLWATEATEPAPEEYVIQW